LVPEPFFRLFGMTLSETAQHTFLRSCSRNHNKLTLRTKQTQVGNLVTRFLYTNLLILVVSLTHTPPLICHPRAEPRPSRPRWRGVGRGGGAGARVSARHLPNRPRAPPPVRAGHGHDALLRGATCLGRVSNRGCHPLLASIHRSAVLSSPGSGLPSSGGEQGTRRAPHPPSELDVLRRGQAPSARDGKDNRHLSPG
jgi:hypothetical protein